MALSRLHPGQTVRVRVEADDENSQEVAGRLDVRVYRADDELRSVYGPDTLLESGASLARERERRCTKSSSDCGKIPDIANLQHLYSIMRHWVKVRDT